VKALDDESELMPSQAPDRSIPGKV